MTYGSDNLYGLDDLWIRLPMDQIIYMDQTTYESDDLWIR